MSTTTNNAGPTVPRRSFIRRVGLAGGLAALAHGRIMGGHGVGRAAAQATPMPNAGHPLVGTWIVDPEVDTPGNPPSFDAFMADGTLVNIGSDGASVGSWAPTGPRSASMTFAGLVLDSGGASAFILRGDLEVDETGDGLTGSHSFTLVGADGSVIAAFQGGAASGVRLRAEPMAQGGAMLPGFPTWTPAAPETGTPTA